MKEEGNYLLPHNARGASASTKIGSGVPDTHAQQQRGFVMCNSDNMAEGSESAAQNFFCKSTEGKLIKDGRKKEERKKEERKKEESRR